MKTQAMSAMILFFLIPLFAGCQTYQGGLTLPAPRYVDNPPQYFPQEPSFPLAMELPPGPVTAKSPAKIETTPYATLVKKWKVETYHLGVLADEGTERVIELIVSMVEPESWAAAGGKGRIAAFRGRTLVIAQEETVHKEIEGLLANLKGLANADATSASPAALHGVQNGTGVLNAVGNDITHREKIIRITVAARQDAESPKRMGINDVVALVRGKVSDDIIVNQMRTTGTIFALTIQDIVLLKANQVSDRVIIEMQNSRSETVNRSPN